jgi:hypothetical protein
MVRRSMRRAPPALRIAPERGMNRSFMCGSCFGRNLWPMRGIGTAMAAALLLAAVAVHGDEDHERARRAREKGDIVPLSRILAAVEAGFEGRLLEVELEDDDGRLVYEIELLTAQSNVIELTYDARTGAFLEAEGRGVEAARKRE